MVKRFSKKRAKQNRLYLKLREKFLQDNPMCQVGLPGCRHTSTTVHHVAGRQGLRLIDVNNFLAACMPCHETIEHEPEMAKENGFSKSRLSVIEQEVNAIIIQ